ncbi:MAG: L-seryl-tRNA(Sec) selenium transferase [Planctomycetota bacterium]|nr:L-seryl-tRNA(Sec) selenium transferase [Planctomycetota bacterium]MDA1250611.1 L-seryl-tRNA(Sec) selenium transferase [Planctomycetota bacterium]
MSLLRNLPSIHEILEHSTVLELAGEFGRPIVRNWTREELDRARAELRAIAAMPKVPDAPERQSLLDQIVVQVASRAVHAQRVQLQRVINATGVVLHTGLGRSPLSAAAKQALVEAAGACNVEVDLESSARRYRGYQLEPAFRLLTGCESSLIVNNNAAATLLTLQALCRGREVIISRGELIEIGGSFRLPEIFELSGAVLREVGTTNRTSLSDYENAIGPDTAAIMHVHPSNFRVVGFTHKPREEDLFKLARKHNVLAIDDIGSGALYDVTEAGLPDEPTFQHSMLAGADLILGSGDKLLGGPQCGIILGRGELVERVRKHPLARAVRVGKLTIAALSATLDSYVRDTATADVPTLAMLTAKIATLHARAKAVVEKIGNVDGLSISIREDVAQIGGGSLPAIELPTIVIALRHDDISAGDFSRRLRLGRIPVFGRVQNNEVLLDLRSVQTEDDSRLALAARLVRADDETGEGTTDH